MAAAFKYDEKDVPTFKETMCPKCVSYGHCDDKDNHWFLMCPKYHQWKLGYTNYMEEQIKYQMEHPEEVEATKLRNKKISEAIKTRNKKEKKEKKETIKKETKKK